MKILVGVLLLIGINACSSTQPISSEAQVSAQKPVEKIETGSLWTESSNWNRLYSSEFLRKKGDIVFVKPEGKFQEELSEKGTSSSQNKESVVAYIPARIEEANQGVYTLKAEQKYSMGTSMQELKFTGTAREKDIEHNDMISSEKVLGLNWEFKKESSAPKEKEDVKKENKEIKENNEEKIAT